jgi:ribonuclease HI
MSAKKSKKNRKHGNNSAYCQFYKNSKRREHNKVTKLKKHLVRFPNDACAKAAMEAAKAAF